MKAKKVTSRNLAQQHTRATLLSAAGKLVAEKGFGGVSIGDVATESGFTKGAVYSNFESREAMLHELLRHVHLEQRAAMSALDNGAVPPLDRALDQLLDLVMRHLNSPNASLMVGEVQLQAHRNADFAARIREGFDEQLILFAKWIEEVLAAAGRRPAFSPRELARAVMALSQGFSQQPADRTAVKAIMRKVLGLLFAQA